MVEVDLYHIGIMLFMITIFEAVCLIAMMVAIKRLRTDVSALMRATANQMNVLVRVRDLLKNSPVIYPPGTPLTIYDDEND